MELHHIAVCKKIFISWPDTKGWIRILLVLLTGLMGTGGLIWKSATWAGNISDRVTILEKDHDMIAATKKNTDEIKKMLMDQSMEMAK